MRSTCPDCKGLLQWVNEDTGSRHRVWYCRRAIEVQMWNPVLRRHYMPEGDPHARVKRWTESELVQAGEE
jgi:hypothetical protein